MQLTVDLIERKDPAGVYPTSWIAIATVPGATGHDDAGIGKASSKSLAAQAAVRSYYERQKVLDDAREAIKVAGEARPQPVGPRTDDFTTAPVEGATWRNQTWEMRTEPPASWSKRVAVSPPAIRTMIREAIDNEDDVLITGTKVTGESYTDRRISPFNLRMMGMLTPREVVRCMVPEGGERSFYLDLITRVEQA